jgi:hypothetical protein
MNCREAQDWLLQAEQPRQPDASPPAVADHLRTCPDCRRLVARVERLEADWRALPLPPGAERARQRFLDRRAARPPARGQPAARRGRLARWAAAILFLLTLGLGTWALTRPRPGQAPDLVDRLIGLNLELSEAPSPDERERIFSDRAGPLRADLDRARLPDEERQLAEYLLETGAALAHQADPLEDAARFDALADRLLQRLRSASAQEEGRDLGRCARQYEQVLERGVDANLERAKAGKKLGPRQKQKIKGLLQRDAERAAALDGMLEAGPPHDPEARKALDRPRKRHKHRHRGWR